MTTISMLVAMVAGTASVYPVEQLAAQAKGFDALPIAREVAETASINPANQLAAQAKGFDALPVAREVAVANHGFMGSARYLADGSLLAEVRAQVTAFGLANARVGKYLPEPFEAMPDPWVVLRVHAPATGAGAQQVGTTRELLATGTIIRNGVSRNVEIILNVSLGVGESLTVSGDIPLQLGDFSAAESTRLGLPTESKLYVHFKVNAPQNLTYGGEPVA